MAKKIDQTVIAVDIGTDSLKAVLLAPGDEKNSCLGMLMKPLARGDAALKSLTEALTEVAQKFGAHTRRAVLVTPERMVLYKFSDKPLMPRDQLQRVMDNEMKLTMASAQSNIAATEVDRIDFLYSSLGTIGADPAKKNHLMSVFVSMHWLDHYTTIFKKAGLSLESTYTLPQATHELYAAELVDEEDSRLVATLNIGASANYLTVSRGNTLLLGRSFPFAGDEINKALTTIAGPAGGTDTLSRADAENWKKVVGMLSPEEMETYDDEECLEIRVSNKIRSLIGQAMQKVRLALEYVKTQESTPVTKIMLSGGGALMHGMVDALKEAFSNNDIEILDPLRAVSMNCTLEEEDGVTTEQMSMLAQALGAGVCALQQKERMIDLYDVVRRERALLKRQLIEKYVPSAAIIILGALAVTGYYMIVYRGYLEEKKQLTLSARMAADTYKPPLTEFKPKMEEIVKEKRYYEARVETAKTLTNTRVRWSKFFLQVASVIPAEVWLESLKVSQTASATLEIALSGKSSSMTLVNLLLQRLQNSGIFVDLTWKGSKHEGQAPHFGFSFVGIIATDAAGL